MSTVTGNSAAYHASVEAPDDGDERDAEALQVIAEAAMDNTAFLYARVVGGSEVINTGGLNVAGTADIAGSAHVGGSLTVDGNLTVHGTANVHVLDVDLGADVGGDVVVTGGSVTSEFGYFLLSPKTVTIAIDGPAETDDGWEFNRSTNDFFWSSTSTSQRRIRLCLNAVVPRNANITQIVARFKGAPGHSALPGGMPTLILYRKRIGTTGAASGVVDSTNDGSADTTAYQAEHNITLTLGTPHTADTSTHSYYAVITSESDGGSNAIAGAEFYGLRVTYTYSRVDRQ
ncbi:MULTISPECIES: hypothetical protein [Sorangium]|uniref:Uncharacterized protein n=1 Tax=Sorangium cellulosum TaxID=56 RepID=A0A4P2QT17_SORCE|nr:MULTISPECIES: hypothetical protein [Sorangium]AUX33151.1 uncharacterized protein SOCE836_053050 [Sorangium cellulosum]AUX33208.1 uncharacterized protein SOCE836_053620 [Sorangium cellulosum]WCQ92527.1 hypothetical protein NQZ70_05268 [Sorangium sp. Soce836]